MSQLIQMRQRINAIATIKKITHATRLIAMSAHTRLSNREPIMAHYREEIRRLFSQLIGQEPIETPIITTTNPQSTQSLVILIGAQKGFCGTFNTILFKFLENHFPTSDPTNNFICIGKKAIDYVRAQGIEPHQTFNNLTNSTTNTIATVLTEKILTQAPQYKQIVVVGNYPRTFFNQKPQATTLLPLEQTAKEQTLPLDAYDWPESRQHLISTLFGLYLQASLESLLFSSLAAEQAARFHSMDNATRNANDLLDTMYRDYNKLRQTKITKELIELSGSFQR